MVVSPGGGERHTSITTVKINPEAPPASENESPITPEKHFKIVANHTVPPLEKACPPNKKSNAALLIGSENMAHKHSILSVDENG